MKDKDALIYDLIFSENTEYKIDISEYIDDIYRYDRFVEDIKEVLKKSKVMIIKDVLSLESNSALWILKVKR